MRPTILLACLAAVASIACGGTRRVVPTPQPVGPQTAADSVALAITIYTVAFTNGTQTAHAANLPELVCVRGTREDSDPPAEVIEALQANRTLLVRPISACRQEPLGGPSPRGASLVIDTLTGKRGISVSATEPTVHDDGTFTVGTSYYQHGLSAGGWTCRGKRRVDDTWEITTCKMDWIS